MDADAMILTLKRRFEANQSRHIGVAWPKVEARLKQSPQKVAILMAMEVSGGEPDVVASGCDNGEYTFFDCAEQSPSGRRSFCYDNAALEARKEHKPKNSAINMATQIGVELLDEAQYQFLQTLGDFDTKTSSWLKTPISVREKGGAIFGDCRFGRVFIYHNGADSYYAARGFRCALKV